MKQPGEVLGPVRLADARITLLTQGVELASHLMLGSASWLPIVVALHLLSSRCRRRRLGAPFSRPSETPGRPSRWAACGAS